jgi:hypothetical protein
MDCNEHSPTPANKKGGHMDKHYNSDLLTDWLSHLTPRAFVTTPLARGIASGMLSALMAVGFEKHDALGILIKYLPDDFELQRIPRCWVADVDSTEQLRLNFDQITPFQKLLAQLNEEGENTSDVRYQLLDKYLWEVGRLDSYSEDAKLPDTHLAPFRRGGTQMISEFWVNDLTKEDDPSRINFHGQNISRWVYAGAIVVQDGRVTTHH